MTCSFVYRMKIQERKYHEHEKYLSVKLIINHLTSLWLDTIVTAEAVRSKVVLTISKIGQFSAFSTRPKITVN